MKKYNITKSFTYDGKRYYIRADSEAHAVEKMVNKLRDLKDGKVVVNGNMRFSEWGMHCLKTYKVNQNKRTFKNCMSIYNNHIEPQLGNYTMAQIKPIHCQNCLNDAIGLSKYTIGLINQLMNFIFESAIDNNIIVKNPAKRLTKPKGSVNKRRSITEKERKYIIDVATNEKRFNMYLLMLYCGCRPSEATECMGKDIQNMNGYNVLHIRGTKSANADRYVPIPDELYYIIKDTKPFQYIATTSTGKKIQYNHQKRVWQGFKRQLNLAMGCKTYRNKLVPPYPLAEDLVPYCLRHTYCTDLQKNGIDLKTAQYLMGHSEIRLTADIYTHTDNSTIILAAEKISGVAPPVAPDLVNG